MSCYWGIPWWENPYAFLHRLEPVERIGDSFLVFEVPDPPPSPSGAGP